MRTGWFCYRKEAAFEYWYIADLPTTSFLAPSREPCDRSRLNRTCRMSIWLLGLSALAGLLLPISPPTVENRRAERVGYSEFLRNLNEVWCVCLMVRISAQYLVFSGMPRQGLSFFPFKTPPMHKKFMGILWSCHSTRESPNLAQQMCLHGKHPFDSLCVDSWRITPWFSLWIWDFGARTWSVAWVWFLD